jgi:hypothetical protein
VANITLDTLKPKTAKLNITHPATGETMFALPDGTEVPFIIYVVGRNSPQWANFMKKMHSTTTQIDVRSKVVPEALEFAASLIVGWEDNGIIDEPYSPEAALSLIKNTDNIWLLGQIQNFFLDESNFFGKT